MLAAHPFLRRTLGLKRLGVTELRGPLRLDRSAFTPGTAAPGDFDGEPWRVGNAQPEELLLNAKAITYTVRVDGAQARITADPPLDPPQTVPTTTAPCFANSIAIARPMPRDAPVTNAI